MVQDRKTNPGAKTTEGDETFVERWSRRKREDRAAGPQPAQPPATEAPSDPDPGPSDADLPPPESLGPDSDYSGYLSGRVSENLRRAALRRLFRLPQFNVRDGLDDYDENYRSFAGLGDTITADMRHHEQRLREKAREEEARRAAGGRAEDEPAETTGEPGDDAPGDTTAEGAERDTPAAPDDADGDGRDA